MDLAHHIGLQYMGQLQLNLNDMNNILRCIFFATLCCFTFSCSESKKNNDKSGLIKEDDKIRNAIKENSGILIPDYKMEESSSDQAMGDYTESYVIKFDSLDFQDIISQIQNSKYYIDEFNPSVPSNTVLKEDKLRRWSKANFGYKFEYFMDGTDKLILYEVNTSNYTIYSAYAEE